MIAIVISSAAFDPATMGILAAVIVAGLGIGPLAAWAFQQPRVLRMVVATAMALVIGSVLLLADPAVQLQIQNAYWVDCDQWINYLLCWVIWG